MKGVCIEVQGSLADINAINRTNEFKKIEDKGDLKIVARIPSEWNPEKVLSGLNDSLRAHPEANCLLLASDWAIDAVQAALEKVDKWYPTGDPEAHVDRFVRSPHQRRQGDGERIHRRLCHLGRAGARQGSRARD